MSQINDYFYNQEIKIDSKQVFADKNLNINITYEIEDTIPDLWKGGIRNYTVHGPQLISVHGKDDQYDHQVLTLKSSDVEDVIFNIGNEIFVYEKDTFPIADRTSFIQNKPPFNHTILTNQEDYINKVESILKPFINDSTNKDINERKLKLIRAWYKKKIYIDEWIKYNDLYDHYNLKATSIPSSTKPKEGLLSNLKYIQLVRHYNRVYKNQTKIIQGLYLIRYKVYTLIQKILANGKSDENYRILLQAYSLYRQIIYLPDELKQWLSFTLTLLFKVGEGDYKLTNNKMIIKSEQFLLDVLYNVNVQLNLVSKSLLFYEGDINHISQDGVFYHQVINDSYEWIDYKANKWNPLLWVSYYLNQTLDSTRIRYEFSQQRIYVMEPTQVELINSRWERSNFGHKVKPESTLELWHDNIQQLLTKLQKYKIHPFENKYLYISDTINSMGIELASNEQIDLGEDDELEEQKLNQYNKDRRRKVKSNRRFQKPSTTNPDEELYDKLVERDQIIMDSLLVDDRNQEIECYFDSNMEYITETLARVHQMVKDVNKENNPIYKAAMEDINAYPKYYNEMVKHRPAQLVNTVSSYEVLHIIEYIRMEEVWYWLHPACPVWMIEPPHLIDKYIQECTRLTNDPYLMINFLIYQHLRFLHQSHESNEYHRTTSKLTLKHISGIEFNNNSDIKVGKTVNSLNVLKQHYLQPNKVCVWSPNHVLLALYRAQFLDTQQTRQQQTQVSAGKRKLEEKEEDEKKEGEEETQTKRRKRRTDEEMYPGLTKEEITKKKQSRGKKKTYIAPELLKMDNGLFKGDTIKEGDVTIDLDKSYYLIQEEYIQNPTNDTSLLRIFKDMLQEYNQYKQSVILYTEGLYLIKRINLLLDRHNLLVETNQTYNEQELETERWNVIQNKLGIVLDPNTDIELNWLCYINELINHIDTWIIASKFKVNKILTNEVETHTYEDGEETLEEIQRDIKLNAMAELERDDIIHKKLYDERKALLKTDPTNKLYIKQLKDVKKRMKGNKQFQKEFLDEKGNKQILLNVGLCNSNLIYEVKDIYIERYFNKWWLLYKDPTSLEYRVVKEAEVQFLHVVCKRWWFIDSKELIKRITGQRNQVYNLIKSCSKNLILKDRIAEISNKSYTIKEMVELLTDASKVQIHLYRRLLLMIRLRIRRYILYELYYLDHYLGLKVKPSVDINDYYAINYTYRLSYKFEGYDSEPPIIELYEPSKPIEIDDYYIFEHHTQKEDEKTEELTLDADDEKGYMEKCDILTYNCYLLALNHPPIKGVATPIVPCTPNQLKSILYEFLYRVQYIDYAPDRISQIKEFLLSIHWNEILSSNEYLYWYIAYFYDLFAYDILTMKSTTHMNELNQTIQQIITNTINSLNFTPNKAVSTLLITFYKSIRLYINSDTIISENRKFADKMIFKYSKHTKEEEEEEEEEKEEPELEEKVESELGSSKVSGHFISHYHAHDYYHNRLLYLINMKYTSCLKIMLHPNKYKPYYHLLKSISYLATHSNEVLLEQCTDLLYLFRMIEQVMCFLFFQLTENTSLCQTNQVYLNKWLWCIVLFDYLYNNYLTKKLNPILTNLLYGKDYPSKIPKLITCLQSKETKEIFQHQFVILIYYLFISIDNKFKTNHTIEYHPTSHYIHNQALQLLNQIHTQTHQRYHPNLTKISIINRLYYILRHTHKRNMGEIDFIYWLLLQYIKRDI